MRQNGSEGERGKGEKIKRAVAGFLRMYLSFIIAAHRGDACNYSDSPLGSCFLCEEMDDDDDYDNNDVSNG